MNCANHPDVAAMGVCRTCGRPLCSLCVYFRDGQLVCDRHAGAGVAGSVVAPLAGAATDPADAPIAGAAVAPPVPVYVGDPRLDPLPMSLRPGWPDEPPQPRPNTLAETLGLVGLILAVVALPFSICCGFGGGAVIGAPLALIGGGLGIAALVRAPRTRNPAQARWMGGVGIGLSALDLAISVCYLAAFATLTASTGPFHSTFLFLTAQPTP